MLQLMFNPGLTLTGFRTTRPCSLNLLFSDVPVAIAVVVILNGLHTANLSWQTRVGKPNLVCVNGTKTGGKHVCKLLASNRNVFADCFYTVHTHQLEFANTSLPTLVCRVKAALNSLMADRFPELPSSD